MELYQAGQVLGGTAVIKKINALDARKQLGRLLEEVYYKGDQYVIERAGKPMAAVVPVGQLEEQKKRRERLFRAVKEVLRRNKSVKSDIIETEVEEAARAARAKPKRRKA